MRRIILTIALTLLLVGCGSGTLMRGANIASVPATPPAPTPPAASSAGTATPVATPSRATTLSTTAASTGTVASPIPSQGAPLTLSPSSGPPGTKVTIHGSLPASAGKPGDSTILCWGGCLNGMQINLYPISWSTSQPGSFSVSFTVPQTAWVESGRIVNPVLGSYSVQLICLGVVAKGCALDTTAQASGVFRMTAGPANTCNPAACARLSLSPSYVRQGGSVQVHGWAPLAQLIGTMPYGYSLVLEQLRAGHELPLVNLLPIQQALDGTISGTLQLPLTGVNSNGPLPIGNYFVGLAVFISNTNRQPPPDVLALPIRQGSTIRDFIFRQAPLKVIAAPSWTSLKPGKPLRIAPSASINGTPVSIDPSNQNRVAYCAANAIRVSTDAGAHWSTIPVSGVVGVAATEGYPLMSELPKPPSPPVCQRLLLDPAQPKSYFAVFTTYEARETAPPTFWLGFVTSDAGASWEPVPVPTGYTASDFGGYRLAGKSVLALFSKPANGYPGPATSFTALRTNDGGRSWTTGSLPCPTTGPCVSWGPAPSSIGGSGSPAFQPLSTSTDAGRTWQSVEPPVGVNLHSSSQTDLVALTSSKLALLGASSLNLSGVQISLDGGRSWQLAMLPPLPGTSQPPVNLSDLLMLPDGALLAIMGYSGGPMVWDLLPAGASTWCPVSSKILPASANDLVSSKTRLWWFDYAGNPKPGQVPPHSTPLSAFRCGG